MSQSNGNPEGHSTPWGDTHEQSSIYPSDQSSQLSSTTVSKYSDAVTAGLPVDGEGNIQVRHSDFRAGYVSKISARILGLEDYEKYVDDTPGVLDMFNVDVETVDEDLTKLGWGASTWLAYAGERSHSRTIETDRMIYGKTGHPDSDSYREFIPPTLDGDTGSIQPANPMVINIPFCHTVEFEVHFEDMGYIFENASRYDSNIFEWIVEDSSGRSLPVVPLITSAGSLADKHAFTARFCFPYTERLSWTVKLRISDPNNNHDNFFGFGQSTTWKIADCISDLPNLPQSVYTIGDGTPVICSTTDTVDVSANIQILGLTYCNTGTDTEITNTFSLKDEDGTVAPVESVSFTVERPYPGGSDTHPKYGETVEVSIFKDFPVSAGKFTLVYTATVKSAMYGTEWQYDIPVGNFYAVKNASPADQTNEQTFHVSRVPGDASSIVWSEQHAESDFPNSEGNNWILDRSVSSVKINKTNTSLPGYIVNGEERDSATIRIASKFYNNKSLINIEENSASGPWNLTGSTVGVIDGPEENTRFGSDLWQSAAVTVNDTCQLRTRRESILVVDGERVPAGCYVTDNPVDVLFVKPKQDLADRVNKLKPVTGTGWNGSTTINLSWNLLDDIKYSNRDETVDYTFPVEYKVHVYKWEDGIDTKIGSIDVDSGTDEIVISSDENANLFNKLASKTKYYFDVCPVFGGKDLWHNEHDKGVYGGRSWACLDDEHWTLCSAETRAPGFVILSDCSGLDLVSTSSSSRSWYDNKVEYFHASNDYISAVEGSMWDRGGVISRSSHTDHHGNRHYHKSRERLDVEEVQVLRLQLDVAGKTLINLTTAADGNYATIHKIKDGSTDLPKDHDGTRYLSWNSSVMMRIQDNAATDKGNIVADWRPVNITTMDITGYSVEKVSGRGILSVSGDDWEPRIGYTSLTVSIDDTPGLDTNSSIPETANKYLGQADTYIFVLRASCVKKKY